MSKPKITTADLFRAAHTLQCEVAVVRAITRKESRKAGFLPDGQPAVLFERHIFSKLTGGKFDKTHPHLSNKTPGGYGAAGQNQHNKIAAAAKLDREAALQSASWGAFQIMGMNWRTCGFASLQAFINAMYRDEVAHLDAFVQFIRNESKTYPLAPHKGMKLLAAVRAKLWKVIAYLYNGPKYAINKYDASLIEYYDEAPAGEKRVPDAPQDTSKGGAK